MKKALLISCVYLSSMCHAYDCEMMMRPIVWGADNHYNVAEFNQKDDKANNQCDLMRDCLQLTPAKSSDNSNVWFPYADCAQDNDDVVMYSEDEHEAASSAVAMLTKEENESKSECADELLAIQEKLGELCKNIDEIKTCIETINKDQQELIVSVDKQDDVLRSRTEKRDESVLQNNQNNSSLWRRCASKAKAALVKNLPSILKVAITCYVGLSCCPLVRQAAGPAVLAWLDQKICNVRDLIGVGYDVDKHFERNREMSAAFWKSIESVDFGNACKAAVESTIVWKVLSLFCKVGLIV